MRTYIFSVKTLLIIFWTSYLSLDIHGATFNESDSLSIILHPKDLVTTNKNALEYDNIVIFTSRIQFVPGDRVDSLFNNLNILKSVQKSVAQKRDELLTLPIKLIITEDQTYFVSQRAYYPDSISRSRVWMFLAFMVMVTLAIVFAFYHRKSLKLQNEIGSLNKKYKIEYEAKIKRANLLQSELIGKLENAHNPLGEVHNFLLKEISNLERNNKNIGSNPIIPYEEKKTELTIQYLNTLFTLCCKCLRLENFGRSGEIRKFNTKYHFTFKALPKNPNVQIITCGWMDSETKRILKKAFVENVK